jgi:hypothetical protein
MRVKDSNGRDVLVELCGDEPNDIQISSAKYRDGTPIPEYEVEFILNRYDFYPMWLDNQILASETYFEGER